VVDQHIEHGPVRLERGSARLDRGPVGFERASMRLEPGSLLVGRGLSRRRRRRFDHAVRQQARDAASRYRLVYDARGPKVRLGVLWFLVALAALALGPPIVAGLFAGLAAVAALQTGYCRRRDVIRPVRAVSALIAFGLPLAALAGSRAVGAALIVAVALALGSPRVPGALRAGRDGAPTWRAVPVDVAAATLAAGLFVGLAGASVVLAREASLAGAIVLLVLVAAYEIGDYVVGTGAANVVEGPAAGIIGLLVVTFTVSLLRPAPLDHAVTVWVLGALTAALCPLGQLLATSLLPNGSAFAPALRRLDSWLLAAPLWAVVLLTRVGLG
jgi:hypothetical protein